MENRSRRTVTSVTRHYALSSDDGDSDNDDSSYVLEDGFNSTVDSDDDSHPMKRKIGPKPSRKKIARSQNDETAARVSKTRRKMKCTETELLTNTEVSQSFDCGVLTGTKSSSLVSGVKVTKRSKVEPSIHFDCSQPKKIKLETFEHEPDFTKVKVERVSLSTSDRKPDMKIIKSESCVKSGRNVLAQFIIPDGKKNVRSRKANESDHLDCKANISKLKFEKNVKRELGKTDAVASCSKTKLSQEVLCEIKSEINEKLEGSSFKKNIKEEYYDNTEKSGTTKISQVKKEQKVKCEVENEKFGNEKFSCNHKSRFRLGELNWECMMLSEKANIDFRVARCIINMLRNECTIPFIARYRRNQTGGLGPDQLRHVKDTYDDIKTLETKAQNVLKKLQKLGQSSEQIERSINSVQSLDELDYIYAPYKQNSQSKAEKAKALGLEAAAHLILNGNKPLIVNTLIDSSKEGLKNKDEVLQNVQNIIADIFSKNDAVLDYLREAEKKLVLIIKSTKMKVSKNESKKKATGEDTLGKFELYYDFQTTTAKIQPHQILALNRGESLKILSVKMMIPDWLPERLYTFCETKWIRSGFSYTLRTQMFRSSFNDAYTRLISPFLIRRARSDLNLKAQRAAIENFAVNLKNLLQTPPVKGCSILGIDPGFRHGFKFALINSGGDVEWTNVFHFNVDNKGCVENENTMGIVRQKLISHKCELIAIGNGTGCRAIEAVMSHFISNNFFKPDLNVRYTIVNERGASIYSCSTLAKEEFPDLDPNLVSAVFIARSLQDPLNEYVKVEPKHLGVGMYQHDVPENRLNTALDEIVSECVSFTGVDVNTASVHLLKRISGLGIVRANNIIEWRRKNGPFKNREQLQLVNRIGQKTYEQCSGFIRIHWQNVNISIQKSKMTKSGINEDQNPLDTTWIHPESYTTAYVFIDKCKVDLFDLGTENFIARINEVIYEEGIEKIASDLNENVDTVSLIVNALIKPRDYDYRSQFAKPFFKEGLADMSSLKIGMSLAGVVSNVTNFGAFVDIGVDKNGLIHVSRFNGNNVHVGDRIEVEIISIETQRNRIGLNLLNIFH